MPKKNKNINLESERYGLFMSNESFDLDIEYGRDFLKQDNVQYVTIYKVDIIKSKSHTLYGQSKAKDKIFFTPVKINVMIIIEPSTQEYYGDNDGGITREDTGKLIFGVYEKELNEKKLTINRGDYVGYNLSGEKERYYEIENSNIINDTSDKTIAGFKPYYRKIIAVPVKEDVLPLINSI